MKIVDRGAATTGSADVAKAQENARVGRPDTKRTGAGGASGGTDRVELSSAAGRVRQALDASAASRAQRVGELQAAYRAGAYQPDSRETSRGMVREALAGGVE
jgi:anti-sigma28 factor (negative regulator of flagellin synthesis)